MFKQTLIIIASIGLSLSYSISGFGCETGPISQKKQCSEPTPSAFRYVIVYNDELESSRTAGPKQTFRVVNVLLDKKSFSEPILKVLFELLSKRFPKSDHLFVHVYTDLEDVYTPEEAEQTVTNEKCDTLRADKHPSAIYNRVNASEGFQYSTNEPGSEIMTVRLRGKS